MDLSTLAKDVVTFLAPFLPYLVKGAKLAGQEAAKKLGERVSEESVAGAKSLWEKLRPKVEAKPAAKEAAQEVANDPDNADAQAALRLQLRKILAEDKSLAVDIAHLWQQMQAAGTTVIASGKRSVAVGRDVIGSVIITGDDNRIER